MRRLAFAALLLLALSACADMDDLDPGLNVGLVVVGETKQCTAFAVDTDTWMSAHHCFTESNRGRLWLETGWTDVHVMRRNIGRDQVWLRSDVEVEEPLDTCEPHRLQHVCGCGYRASLTLTCECGSIYWIGGSRFYATVASRGGWSGGLIVGSDGCVVGTISRGGDGIVVGRMIDD